MASSNRHLITTAEESQPWQPSSVYALTQRMKDLLGREGSDIASSKQELKELAQKLSVALESPTETIERLVFYVRTPFLRLSAFRRWVE